MTFLKLKINRNTSQEGSRSWINIVVNAVAYFRIKSIVFGNYHWILYGGINPQTLKYIGQVVRQGYVVNAEKRSISDKKSLKVSLL